MRGIREINRQIETLTSSLCLLNDPRVSSLIRLIRKENEPKVEALKQELQQVVINKKEPKPRWPANTPQPVLDLAFHEFRGTTEFHSFRIHCWNDKAFWCSYPSGGYSDNGGYHPTPACFTLVSLSEKNGYNDKKGKSIMKLTGRVSTKTMMDELNKLTQ